MAAREVGIVRETRRLTAILLLVAGGLTVVARRGAAEEEGPPPPSEQESPIPELPPEKLPPRTAPPPDPATEQYAPRGSVWVRIKEIVHPREGEPYEPPDPIVGPYVAEYFRRAGYPVVDDPSEADFRIEGEVQAAFRDLVRFQDVPIATDYEGSVAVTIFDDAGEELEDVASSGHRNFGSVSAILEPNRDPAEMREELYVVKDLRRQLAKVVWDHLHYGVSLFTDAEIPGLIDSLAAEQDASAPVDAAAVIAKLAARRLDAVPYLIEALGDTRQVLARASYPGLTDENRPKLRVFHLADRALEEIFQKVSRMGLDTPDRHRFIIIRGWENEWKRFCRPFRESPHVTGGAGRKVELFPPVPPPPRRAAPVELFVSTRGDDGWTGALPRPADDGADGPFATLERARDELRRLRASRGLDGGATVWLRGGTYRLGRTFQLTAEDSGAPGAEIVYRAYGDEEVVLSGGRPVTGFEPVTEPAVLGRLDERARGAVVRADLSAAGVADLGDVATVGRRIELFFDGRPMPLARWPDEGFTRIEAVTGGDTFTSHGIRGDRIGRFTVADRSRLARWSREKALWLHGYWFWDWSDAFQRVASIDVEKGEIALAPPHHGYGYRPGQRFYAVNALSELDRPGEWYVDHETAELWFWPPGDLEAGRPTVSALDRLVDVEGAAHVVLRCLTLEMTRGTAVTIRDGTGCRLERCTIRNTGSWAVTVSGTDCGVFDCEIEGTGEGGIALSGGDRATLTPARLAAENNHIHRFARVARTYRPAVRVGGVGNRVAHNLIHDAPHAAILLGGNDHVIELNEIHHVCEETGDVGAFYMGRDWTERGTVIRHNFFHDIRGPGLHGAMAVYLDDAASGMTVFGNVFYRAGRAAFVGGGRDNRIENNVFVDCEPSVHVDARGLGWMRYHVDEEGIMRKRLAAVPYREPPWSERYPELVGILDGDPGEPRGNVVARNISAGGRWTDVEEKARPLVRFESNLVGEDPRFVDPARMDFRLREDSPAWALGFQRIPFEEIGLRDRKPCGAPAAETIEKP